MKVLFIDDNRSFSVPYIKALQTKYSVEHVKKAAPAIRLIGCDSQIAAIILDVMMPIPEGVSRTSLRSFVNTGFYVLAHIRPVLVDRPVPVILLTNRKPAEIEHRVIKFNKDLRRDTKRAFDQVSFQHKPNCEAESICSVVDAAIKSCK